MREINYVKRVLAHIDSKRQRRIAEAELSDHILFNKEFLTEIGYDEERAFQMAEEKMGDADIVGEQLDSFSVKSNTARIFLSIISVICFILAAITNYFTPFDKSQISFKLFCYTWIVFLISLLVTVLNIKKRSLVGLAFSTLSSAFVCLFSPYYIVNLPVLYFKGINVAESFYISDSASFSFFNMNKAENIVSLTAFLTALSVCCLLAAFVIIRIKRLKNNLKDLKLINSCLIALLILFILGTATFSATVFSTVKAEETLISQTRDAMYILDKAVIDNTDSFFNDDNDVFVKKLIKSVGKDAKVTTNSDGGEGQDITINLNGAEIYYQYRKEGLAYLDINNLLVDLDEESIELFSKEEQEKARDYKREYKNVFLPCMISLCKDEYQDVGWEQGADVSYTSYDSISKNNCITYVYENNELKYKGSNFLLTISGKDTQLNEEQKQSLHKFLIDEFCDNEIYNKYLDYEKDVREHIFGVTYDEKLDEYQIDMYLYTEYSAIVDGKLFEISPSSCEITSLIVSFKNGKTVLMDFWGPDEGTYYSKSIKARFSKKAYNNWINNNYYMYENVLTQRLSNKYNQKVYGRIIGISEDGICEYYEYSDDYNSFEGDIQTMRLDEKN